MGNAASVPANATDQIVALDDAIYVTGGTTCLVFDPATGKQIRQIELPAGLTGAGRTFASGKPIWSPRAASTWCA